jgi:hypothetical protein
MIIKRQDAKAIFTHPDFFQAYSQGNEVVLGWLDHSALQTLCKMVRESETKDFPLLFVKMFPLQPAVRGVFLDYSELLEENLKALDENIPSFIAGCILEAFNNVVSTGPKQLDVMLNLFCQNVLRLMKHAQHTSIYYGIPTGFEGRAAPESLIWYSFLCCVGRDQFDALKLGPPCTRCFDELNRPELEFPNRKDLDPDALIPFIAALLRSTVQVFEDGWKRADLYETMLLFFERVKSDAFNPKWLEIAQHLTGSLEIVNRAKAAFRTKGFRPLALDYFAAHAQCPNLVDVSAIVLSLFEDKAATNIELVKAIAIVETFLKAKGSSVSPELLGVIVHIWNTCRNQTPTHHTSAILQIATIVDRHGHDARQWWTKFITDVKDVWMRDEVIRDISVELPKNTLDLDKIRRWMRENGPAQ